MYNRAAILYAIFVVTVIAAGLIYMTGEEAYQRGYDIGRSEGYAAGDAAALMINDQMKQLNVCAWADIVQKHVTCTADNDG